MGLGKGQLDPKLKKLALLDGRLGERLSKPVVQPATSLKRSEPVLLGREEKNRKGGEN
jgi:hypothetical protein